VSVINNLALSYALDGKANKSEDLLRKAVASGNDDKRVRQNLALVLGLQGKFEEARQVASVDLTAQEAQSNMAYLRNMTASSTQVAAASSGAKGGGDDWSPFAANEAAPASRKTAAAAASQPAAQPKVQLVKAEEQTQAPATKAAQASGPAPKQKVAGTPTLVTPVGATSAKAKAAPATQTAPGAPVDLLRSTQ
jgi:hypothetical protein